MIKVWFFIVTGLFVSTAATAQTVSADSLRQDTGRSVATASTISPDDPRRQWFDQAIDHILSGRRTSTASEDAAR